MLGKPKFKREQQVKFKIFDNTSENDSDNKKEIWLDGVVYVVDAEGTAEQHREVSYDIEALYEGRVALFKHVVESRVAER